MTSRTRSILLSCIVLLVVGAVLVVLRTPTRRSVAGPGTRSAEAPLAEAPALRADAPLPATESRDASVRETPQRRAVDAAIEEEPGTRAGASMVVEGPFLTGQVLDTNGFPVADAVVSVRAKGTSTGLFGFARGKLSEETRTSVNGLFRVPRRNQSENDVTVEVQRRGFLLLEEDRAPDAEKGDADLGTFELEAGVVLAGQVIDAKGNPVAEAAVHRTTPEKEGTFEEMMAFTRRLQQDDPSWTDTDAEGRFEFENEQAGDYVLLVEHKSYPKGRFEGSTSTPGQHLLDLVLQLDPTGTIRGRVRGFPGTKKKTIVRASPARENDEKPADMISAMFAFAPGSGEANGDIAPDGSFLLEGLEIGETYKIQALQMGGFFERADCSDEAIVQTGTEDAELVWIPGGKVRMRVVDSSTAGPIHDLSVRFSWTESESSDMPNTTKKLKFDGPEALLSELRPRGSSGDLNLVIEAQGYLAERTQAPGITLDSEIDLGTIRMKRAPTMRIQVVDAATGAPIKKARVSLTPELPSEEDGGMVFEIRPDGERGRTDASGWCTLPACGTETARIEVWKAGYVRYEREGVPMPTGERREEVAQLVEGGAVKITVEDTSGQRVSNARVRHRDPDGSTSTHEASSSGKLTIKDLEPGEHEFTAARAIKRKGGNFQVRIGEDEEEEEDWVQVGVSSGSKGALVLVVPAAASLEGEVTFGGLPSPNARVTILPDRELSADEEINSRLSARFGNSSRARTDRRGKFRVAEVSVGRHRVRVTQQGGAPPHDVPIEIHEGENRINIELPDGRIMGMVLDARGRPVPNASVVARRAALGDGEEEAQQRRAITSALFGSNNDGHGQTAADGSFVIDGVPKEVPLVIEAGAPGFVAGRTDEVVLSDGAAAPDVRVHLSESGSIRVKVEGATGPFVFVTAQYEGEDEVTQEVAGALAIEGEALLQDLAPGSWRVEVEGEEESETVLVEVRSGVESFATIIAE